jgi:hypothetical protein
VALLVHLDGFVGAADADEGGGAGIGCRLLEFVGVVQSGHTKIG